MSNQQEIPEALYDFIANPSQLTCADLYRSITSDMFISLSDNTMSCLRYNTKTTLWEPITTPRLVSIMQRTMQKWAKTTTTSKIITKLVKDSNDDDIDVAKVSATVNKAIKALHSMIGTNKSAEAVCDTLITEFYDEENVNKLDTNKDTLNFKNGILSLRDHSFRERTCDDYVTQCLDWNYTPKAQKDITKTVKDTLMHICNDDDKFFQHILSVIGYCLTGYTDMQAFFSFLGATAGNGKSTIIEILEQMFPIHFLKMDSRTFNENYQKAHKQFIRIHKNIRVCYIEELTNVCKLDVNLLKDFVSGNKLNTEVLYGSSTDVLLYCKLIIISNSLPKFTADKGINRRGVQSEFKNKFVPDDEYHKAKANAPENCNVYRRDLDLKSKFSSEEFKNAMLHLILPWTKYYYENRTLYDLKTHMDQWKETVKINDQFKEFLDEYFDVTNDDNDRMSKHEFIEMYNRHYGCKLGLNTFLNYIKSNNLRYERHWRVNGSRGVIVGIRMKDDVDEEMVGGNELDTIVRERVVEKVVYVTEKDIDEKYQEILRIHEQLTGMSKKQVKKHVDKPVEEQKTYASDNDDMFDELDKIVEQHLTISFD